MNLVEVATWIQEGYKDFYEKNPKVIRVPLGPDCKHRWVKRYVMQKSKGHLNPKTVSELIELETSIPDSTGMVQAV